MDKLSETLNIDIPDELKDDLVDIEIPENATLEDIAKIALDTFKRTMQSTEFIEPKYRARNLEVSQSYLSLAKDAITSKMDHEYKTERYLNKDTEDKDKEESGSISRQQVLMEIEQARKLKLVENKDFEYRYRG